MRDALLVILGGGIALLGSVLSSMLQARSEADRWIRQRDEERRKDAASALGGVWNLISRFVIDRHLLSFDRDRTPRTLKDFWDEWDTMGRDVRRIAVLDRSLEKEVTELIKSVNLMISNTEIAAGFVATHQNFQGQRDEAQAAKGRAEELIKSIADSLSRDG